MTHITYNLDEYQNLIRSFPPKLNISLGSIDSVSEDGKFGFVRHLDGMDVPTDIWAWGSDDISGAAIKTFPTTSETLYISSDNVNDTNVDVDVHYIDDDGTPLTITPNLDGQTPVSLGVSGFDVNRALVSSLIMPLGNVYITNDSNFTAGVPDDVSKVLAYIPQGFGQTQQCTITVPVDCTCIIDWVNIYMSRNQGLAGSAQVSLLVGEFGKDFLIKRPWHLTTSAPVNEFISGIVVPARSRIVLRVVDISDNDTHFTGVINYYLIGTV